MATIDQTPYWKTLLPIIESGAMQAAIDGEYKYPYRINLYPGTSCMFSCLFCGRNYDAVVKGKHPNIFKQIIEQDDGKDPYRINVSGGLEPLTSPYINEICKNLFEKGYKSRMITNGFLLNEKMLARNPYINTLDHIRVSIYGLSEDEYLTTTRHKKGWQVVKENLTNYNKRSEKTNLNLNYVLIPQNFTKLDQIIDYIEQIGGIGTLSLREDFTFKYEITERNQIQDTLLAFDEKIKKLNIAIDYGYALQDAMNGQNTKLMSVEAHEIPHTQAPQIMVCIDPLGNIYSHKEAGFIDRPGNERHQLGNITNSSLERQLDMMKQIAPEKGDTHFLDAFNHLIYKYIHDNRKK